MACCGVRRRTVRTVFVVTVVALSTFAAQTAAHAGTQTLWQNGHRQTNGSCCGGASMDGWRVDITNSQLDAGNDGCVIASVLATDSDSSNYSQLESGDVHCAPNNAVDGTCGANQVRAKFVETWEKGYGFTCYPHGTWSLNSSDRFRVTRVVPSPVYQDDVIYAAFH